MVPVSSAPETGSSIRKKIRNASTIRCINAPLEIRQPIVNEKIRRTQFRECLLRGTGTVHIVHIAVHIGSEWSQCKLLKINTECTLCTLGAFSKVCNGAIKMC